MAGLPSAAVGRGDPGPGWAALREEEDEEDRGRWGAGRKTDPVTGPQPWVLQTGNEVTSISSSRSRRLSHLRASHENATDRRMQVLDPPIRPVTLYKCPHHLNNEGISAAPWFALWRCGDFLFQAGRSDRGWFFPPTRSDSKPWNEETMVHGTLDIVQ